MSRAVLWKYYMYHLKYELLLVMKKPQTHEQPNWFDSTKIYFFLNFAYNQIENYK